MTGCGTLEFRKNGRVQRSNVLEQAVRNISWISEGCLYVEREGEKESRVEFILVSLVMIASLGALVVIHHLDTHSASRNS